MNIDGLSEATLEKFILNGFIKEFGDIYELERYKDAIIEMDGFGEKSYENLIENIKNLLIQRFQGWSMRLGLQILECKCKGALQGI